MSPTHPALRRSFPFLFAGLAATALVAWPPARGSASTLRQEQGEQEEQEEQGEVLEHAMDAMNGALKALLKGINAENKDKSLELLARLQGGVLTSKSQVPPMAAKIEAAKRAAFVSGYRRLLVDVLATSCKIETAILDGKFDEANALVAKDLTRLKGEGHDTYQEEEEEHRGPRRK